MAKIKLVHEYSEGVYMIIPTEIKDGQAKAGREQLIKFSKNKLVDEQQNVEIGEPIIVTEKTEFGKMFMMPFYQQTLYYKTSFKHNTPIPWGKVVQGNFNAKLWKQMSEEDTTNELLKLQKSNFENWVLIGAVGVACFFLGVFAVGQGFI